MYMVLSKDNDMPDAPQKAASPLKGCHMILLRHGIVGLRVPGLNAAGWLSTWDSQPVMLKVQNYAILRTSHPLHV